MQTRWRGRTAALAIVAAAVAVLTVAAAGTAGAGARTLSVSLPDGQVIARVDLPDDGTFALRYRNSLYGTLAEERFVVGDDGRLRLTGLAAEQLAVLEEYYAASDARQRAGGVLRWEAQPAHAPSELVLRIAATDRGERTLLVAGHDPVALWRFVEDSSPTVLLEVER